METPGAARFRLEGLEVHRGLAWWAAEVVEKRDAAAAAAAARPHSLDDRRARKYKVHYVHWDARCTSGRARPGLGGPCPRAARAPSRRATTSASGARARRAGRVCSGSLASACATAPALR